MNKKLFFLLLAVAALIYTVSRLAPGDPDTYFSAQLVAIDTGRVSALFLIPQNAPDRELLLKREGKTWIASQGPHSIKALHSPVNDLLGKLVLIETSRVAGRGAQVWTECGLEPGKGMRVRAFGGAASLEDFFIGNQVFENGAWYSFMRLAKGDQVYAVRGEWAAWFSPGLDDFRSSAFLGLEPERLNSIHLQLLETGADSVFQPAELESWLADIRSLEGENFANHFDPLSDEAFLAGRITFFATEWESPVEVGWYRDTLAEKPFLFYSSQNPHTWFASDSAGLFARLVAPLPALD